ncbi:ankyrin repeat-containing domain protein [Aspergillus multicolor]|uniref:ankyrin repeat-containing domain protein n=1 Tax=Aspergillus multicolor TaxID=41759 RepID=UPI003CCDE27D
MEVLMHLSRSNNPAMLQALLANDGLRAKYLERKSKGNPDTPLIRTIISGYVELTQILLNAGADFLKSDALHRAARCQSVDVLEVLIEATADVWAKCRNRSLLPIEEALYWDQPVLAQRLLEIMLATEDRASDPDWKIKALHSALMVYSVRAFSIDSVDIIQALIDAGADVFALHDGSRALEILESVYHEGEQNSPVVRQIAACLFQVDPHIWPVSHINRQLWECMQRKSEVDKCHLALFNLLICTNTSALEAVTDSEDTALHYLCDRELLPPHLATLGISREIWVPRPDLPADMDEDRFRATSEMISILLDSGASLSAKNKAGETTLSFAARSPWPGFLALILEKRPNDPSIDLSEDALTDGGTVPIHGAIMAKSLSSVQLLSDHGANVHAIDRAGCNAVHMAVNYEFSPAIKILLDAGCQPCLQSATGITPLRAGLIIRSVAEDNLWYSNYSDSEFPIDDYKIVYDYFTSTWCRIHEPSPLVDGNKAAIELIRQSGRELVKFYDDGTGDLVCMAMEGRWLNWVLAKVLIENGATVHDGCHHCERLSDFSSENSDTEEEEDYEEDQNARDEDASEDEIVSEDGCF